MEWEVLVSIRPEDRGKALAVHPAEHCYWISVEDYRFAMQALWPDWWASLPVDVRRPHEDFVLGVKAKKERFLAIWDEVQRLGGMHTVWRRGDLQNCAAVRIEADGKAIRKLFDTGAAVDDPAGVRRKARVPIDKLLKKKDLDRIDAAGELVRPIEVKAKEEDLIAEGTGADDDH